MDVSIIIPTYQEAENLRVLVPRVADVLDKARLRGEIIVVDDNSPDGTREACEALAAEYPLQLLVRENERGLSSAVIHGMNTARGEILLVMDADLSHPPEKIPELVEALSSEGAEFVIGSRYVPRGSTESGRGLFRWLDSRVATLLSRPLTSLSDPMAGFFALRRSLFEAAPKLDPIGYKIGLELIVKCRCRDVREVPISFGNRLHGESKLSFRERLDYLRHLRRLYEFRLGSVARPLQFALVGGTGSLVDVLFLSLLSPLLGFQPARALAIWIAMTWNFALNRSVTFSYARSGPILGQYVRFCLACSLGAVINWTVSVGLHSFVEFFEDYRVLAAVCGILAGFGFNYFLSSRVVFANRPKK